MLCQQPAAPPAADAKTRLAEIQQRLRSADEATISELVALADKEEDVRIRRAIVDRLGRRNRPDVLAMLERRATTDVDAEISLLALERLRQLKSEDLYKFFEMRLARAKALSEEQALGRLKTEHQKWVTIGRGATLPEFLQKPPAPFRATEKTSIRVFGIGDFGEEGERQTKTAQAAALAHREKPFDFGITLGDNVVPVGVTGPGDPRWKRGWEEIYDPLRVPVYASTGNHDWGLADSPAAEILYSQKSPAWRMPALYYTYTAGPVQFFALATQAFSESQALWLDEELKKSTAKWKVVYGHHPIYTYGPHGNSKELERMLLPVMRGRVNAYIAGHDHVTQHLKPVDGIHLLVTPSGGQGARPAVTGDKAYWVDSFEGILVLEADDSRLGVKFVDSAGRQRYEADLK
ncbi:MAG: metallophosphoesterase [Acidobacteria bacterium]|nr:metallophosphoesterase [Acidobacteriota bacterium]